MALFDIKAGTPVAVRLRTGRVITGLMITHLGDNGALYAVKEWRNGDTLDLNSNLDVPLSWHEVDALLNRKAPAVEGTR